MSEFVHNSEQYGTLDLENLEDVQRALSALGHDPGSADGIDGPNTQRAVREFQESMSIQVDGIVGPDTRGALLDRLDLAASEEA